LTIVVRANIARIIRNCPIFSFSLLLMPFSYRKTAQNSDFELLFTLTRIMMFIPHITLEFSSFEYFRLK
jgi:hypothetical protein